ncbi:tripartite motif-containing protein 2-like [Anneissia japonica]|uniref:tripartite motif-containing protein 2-like n=1 Tax=Anneissia japonica TaxID=1529436 RepID=UPI001425B848|nr:tripartite motif-containing protein 2-like [Anneissia japonica]
MAAADRSLPTLEENKEGTIYTCPTHCRKALEFYCSTCKISACKQCEHIFHCFQNKHEVIKMKIAVDEFNQNATELIQIAADIKYKLQENFDYIIRDRSHFEKYLKTCRAAIKHQEETLVKKIQEKSKTLMLDLEKIYNAKIEDHNSKIKDLDLKQSQVQNLKSAINAIMNKPEQTETLQSHKTTINTIREMVLKSEFDKSFHNMNIIPNFIAFTNLEVLMNSEGIGKIITVDGNYKVAKDDEVITVTKGQQFVVKVSSVDKTDASQLAAILKNSSGNKIHTEVEYGENADYKIMGKCNVEGDWQMEIIVGKTHIEGSPVNITVESLGLVHTIGNISEYKEHNKPFNVSDVVLYTDGCILVSSLSIDILKFNQSGSFVARIQVPQQEVISMYLMDDGQMLYSDHLGKCVVMCDDKFQEIHSFGKGMLKDPIGLTVNKETRVLYVADCEAHCVFKFNVDDGRLLGKIGSKGSKVGKMNVPHDVTLTKEGYVIVADFGNNRIQMFDVNDKLMRILVGKGKEDGKVWGPCGITTDMNENIIVSSNHKLQLFNKNGVFIKRIDYEDDGLDIPAGITVISDRPRRVAVANSKPNNIKIFNY